MPTTIHPSELEAYLDEALPPDDMARIEKALRADRRLVDRLGTIHSRRNAGVHSLGEIWRGERLSCPTREQLGSYLIGAQPTELGEYIKFHLELVGCRFCLANLKDLQSRQAEQPETAQSRRRRYFQSSVGRLRRDV